MTQTQLASAISRTGKYVSEVENGRARLSRAELEKMATAMGVTVETLLQADPIELDQQVEELPRRIRESQPTGLVMFTFQQLIDFLDRAGWLRDCRMWSLSYEPFSEEDNVALVEQLGELVATKNVRLRYVFPVQRLSEEVGSGTPPTQGTPEALPARLVTALRWSNRLRECMDADREVVQGFALPEEFAFFSPLQSHLWVETARQSWSEVMPLLYGRSETRTHENTNASVPFWYHLPRDRGSRMLFNLAQCLKVVADKPVEG